VIGRRHGPVRPVECHVPRREGLFFSREPQALEDAAHGRHAEAQPSLALQLGTELRQRGIGLLAHPLAYEGQGSGVATRLTPTGMGPRRHLPGGAPSAQQLLEKRTADPEQGRQSAL
jgi:hypothetical protein